MHVAPAELDELAAFFARRFDLRLAPVDQEVSATVFDQRTRAWRLHLEDAVEAGSLSALLHRAQSRYPDDANLRELCLLLMEPSRSADQLVGFFLLGSGIAAMGLAAVMVGMVGTWWALALSGAPSVAPVRSAQLASVDVGEVLAPNRSEAAPVSGRCSAPHGGIVGYFYAGARPPVGDAVVMDRMVNVREVFPAKDNGWNARSTISCVLRPGDRVKLSLPPVSVDGGAYWVPLVSGDLRLDS